MSRKSQKVAHSNFPTGSLKLGFAIVKPNALGSTIANPMLIIIKKKKKKKNSILSPLTPPNEPSHSKRNDKKKRKSKEIIFNWYRERLKETIVECIYIWK
jgi:hypothetical protein